MDKIMNICLISDDKFVPYIAALIVSILKNSSENDNFYFHIIEDNIKEENKNKLEMLKEIKEFEIKFYKPNYDNIEKYKKWQETFRKNGRPVWHYSVFIKLDIPFILKDLDNVLFIDADSIVLSELNYIFNIDISNHFFICESWHCKGLKKLDPNLYKYILDIGYKNPEYNCVHGAVLLFNIKEIKEIFTEESYKIKIDECMNKYINSIFTEEHIFLYLFKDCIAFSDLKTDYGENTEKIIISGYFTGIGKPLSLNFNKPINDYYYKFWEYFSLTQFFKDNYFKYLDYFNSARVNRSYSAIYKLVDKIVLFIPIKSIRNRIRNNILKDMDELIKI